MSNIYQRDERLKDLFEKASRPDSIAFIDCKLTANAIEALESQLVKAHHEIRALIKVMEAPFEEYLVRGYNPTSLEEAFKVFRTYRQHENS